MFVDEAYVDFSGETLIGRARSTRMPNLVVGRTFAKATAWPALRVGALVGAPGHAGAAAAGRCRPTASTWPRPWRSRRRCDDRAYYDWYLEQVRAVEATALRRARPAAACATGRARANFVLARFGDRARPCRRRPGGARHLRPRSVDRSRVRGLRPDHGRRRRAHAALHRGARGGPVRRARDRPARPRRRQIRLRLTLDGRGRYDVRTGIRFLDHMLELVARHGAFDLTLARRRATSTSISTTPSRTSASRSAKRCRRRSAPGAASTAPATSSCRWTRRWRSPRSISAAASHAVVDLRLQGAEASATCRRSWCTDFFEGFAQGARANVHVKVLYGRSSHHQVEAVLQGVRARAARRVREGSRAWRRMLPRPSTKGSCCRSRCIDYGAGNLTSVRKGLRGRRARTLGHAGRPGGHWLTRRRHRRARRRPLRGDRRARRRDGARRSAHAVEARRAAARHLPRACSGCSKAATRRRTSPGSALLAGRCRGSRRSDPLKVPHVGWNSLDRREQSAAARRRSRDGTQVYFTHSYAAPVTPRARGDDRARVERLPRS